MRILSLLGMVTLLSVSTANAKPEEMFLYYNATSPNLPEISISEREVAKVYDDLYGTDAEELPYQVQYIDFHVSHYADDSYVFILNAPYNCGNLGCNTAVYRRDADGDLMPSEEDTVPVKCKEYSDDKLICIKGGYKPEVKVKPKAKGPIHYPAPRQN